VTRPASGRAGKKSAAYVVSTYGSPVYESFVSSVAARRDQNRIAQREFRQRKQQRVCSSLFLGGHVPTRGTIALQIRDLEMKVDVLSADKDESFRAVHSILQDLITENQALRQLVKDLSMFVADGIGGAANKVGWDPARYEEFLGRGESDTAHNTYQNWKKNSQRAAVAAERNQGAVEGASVQPVLASIGQKRPGEDLQDGVRKRTRVSPLRVQPE